MGEWIEQREAEAAVCRAAPEEDSQSIFAGGGAAGELMRTIDWAKTPLGPVESWSQALRSTVALVLHNHSAMLLWWGPRFIQIYNDAYRPVLGDKHPRAMGQPFSECWAEVFHILGPMAEQPFRGGPASTSDDIGLALNRKVRGEEAHFRLAYSPVPDETVPGTRIGGVLATVTEITEQVYGERQLRTLRELGARSAAEATSAEQACVTAAATLAANRWDAPFSVLYLLDDDGKRARLAASSGLAEASLAAVAPAEVDLSTDSIACHWPLRQVATERRIETVSDLSHFRDALPRSPWSELPRSAILLPLASPDQPNAYGVLVCGVSPHRQLDDFYRTFFELAAAQIVTVIRNARAYEEEKRRAEQLAELDRAKTMFFSNVSHEFRTPLTLMLGPTEDALAADRPLAGEELRAVHRNELRLLKLVNALLDFSRMEAGRTQALFEPVDVSKLTRDLVSTFRSAIERAGLELRFDCPMISEPIYVDPSMWEKVVLNLLSNALKFTLAGSISVELHDTDAGIELVVSDTGTGIPEAELPHMFERFHRIEGAKGRTHEGSGIGLALVAEIVKMHGGTVEVASTVGEGSRFTVRLRRGTAHLPQQRISAQSRATSAAVAAHAYVEEALRWLPAATSIDSATESIAPARAAPGATSARVLVVDDNADMRDYVGRMLASVWQVDVARNGAEALEAARRQRPDLIVSDVMMPVLDGFGLLREVRNDAALASVPVILLSARAGEESRVEGLQAGADDYLVKPFAARELIARVRTHLELSRLRRAADLAHQRLYALFEQAPAVICVFSGPEHVYRLANPHYLEVVGNRPIVGRPIREALPELAGQGIYELLDHAYSTGERVVRNEVLTKLERNGVLRDIYWDFIYQPYRDADERVEGIMAFGFDVTMQVLARQRAEALAERVQVSEEALRETEQQFRTLADTMPSLAWYANPDGFIPWYNQRWYEYTGTTLDMQEGWKWASVHDPADVERVTAKWRAALESGEPWEDQFRLRRHDGQFRWFLSRALPLRDSEGRIVRWFGTNVDIDDQKRAEAAAEAASRAKDDFLAMLGHELRNPLAPILTALHIMRLRGADKLERERTVIERQANHLVRLVDDLLDVSRITRGKVELKKQQLELGEVIAKAIEMTSPLLEQRNHHLIIDVEATGLLVDVDPERLAQVISNLLNNAAKYTEQGGRIMISALHAGNEVVIRVRDTGIGIAPEILPQVFEMFVQERQALDRSQGGLGLGLTIVRSLVALHGGSVDVRSEGRNRGTEFIIRLPAAVADDRAASEADHSEHVPPRGSADGRRILVVDDNADAAEMVAASLELLGHATCVAHDGPDALKLAEGFAPDIALLDIGLPVMDGYELARRLHELPSLRRVRLVAVTGYGQEGDRRRSAAAGFNAHLVKPVSIDRLATVIKELTADKAFA